ncbi:helix-turn-helix domain-containing protein [Mariprofundus erugo]|uniref:Helix-turn-helix domain-containing protein n=1 Tax=Mariprofundus erugo TaxID=2528639 RepID=A0A5R9GUY0_9PROT|nr:XRE family transcriptional regulator [Mariprofundus erugo]TLS68113.1 helix-turn-helix domain-containing protein [Mariprofundus erugo]TLS75796.1 helix-turn-helix domain-containing protein [Mariprofundus erugo]
MNHRIAAKIRLLREEQGLSQRALAEAAGISAAALSQLESGQNSPSVATLEKLADGLGKTVAAFFLDRVDDTDVEIFSLDERIAVPLKGGSRFVPLTAQHRPAGFEPMLVHLEPAGKLDEALYGIRSAQVFVWARRGRAILEHDGREYEVHETQSVYYDARKPHNWFNPFNESCELLMVRSR